VTDFALQQIVLRACALLLIVAVHGVSVAGAACALGDQGPRYDGRVSLYPLVHIDLLGFVSGVLFSVAWIKPIAIDPGMLRAGRYGSLLLVVIGSVAAILAVAFLLRLVRPPLLPLLGDTSSTLAFALIETIGELAVWFAVINVLPVPPLTGGYLLAGFAPRLGDLMRNSYIYAALLLTAFAATGMITSVLAPVQRAIASVVLGG
jgi:Zn-dependent protease